MDGLAVVACPVEVKGNPETKKRAQVRMGVMAPFLQGPFLG